MNIVYERDKFRETFWTPYEWLAERNGQRFTVLGHNVCLEDELELDTEVRPDLYDIRFEDGFETSAWGEEVCIPVKISQK
jgi:hypothetical protein